MSMPPTPTLTPKEWKTGMISSLDDARKPPAPPRMMSQPPVNPRFPVPKCHLCHEMGHIRPNCPHNRSKNSKFGGSKGHNLPEVCCRCHFLKSINILKQLSDYIGV